MAVLKKQTSGPSVGVLVAAVVALVAVVGALVAIGALLFDPFGTDTVDRSGPALLERMRELEEFTAAEAGFVQDIDIEQDARFLPDFLKGERVVALVQGNVRAVVDFGELDEGSIVVNEDRTEISITLPEPELSDPDIEEGATRVISRSRGLFDRIEDVFVSNPFDDSELYLSAEEKLAAAAGESDLEEVAKENTERWLRAFLTAAGFETVQVNWTTSPE